MNDGGPDLPRRVTLVLAVAAGGTGTHVKMLAAGLAGRGVGTAVAGPRSAEARYAFSALPGVSFRPVEISGRPRAGDFASVLRLRGLLRAAACGPGGGHGHVAHAHGMRAGALTALALARSGRRLRPRLVVTVHNAPPDGPAGLVYRLLERVVARGADLVLCVSPDLERRMRAAGARRVGRAVIAAPPVTPLPAGLPTGLPAGIAPPGRPVVLAAGRLARQKGFGVLLQAAAGWRGLDPAPVVAIAGDGPLAGELAARAAELDAGVRFLGHRDDVPALLAAATVFVLPSRWEGQPLVLQEALRAGTPVVAARVGGVPALTGEDAALLVPPDDPGALAAAVRSVLTDARLGARLRAAAVARAAALPTEADAAGAALRAYAAAAGGPGLR